MLTKEEKRPFLFFNKASLEKEVMYRDCKSTGSQSHHSASHYNSYVAMTFDPKLSCKELWDQLPEFGVWSKNMVNTTNTAYSTVG